VSRDLFDTQPARALNRRARSVEPVTAERLERARTLFAVALLKFGEDAAPFFNRIEAECEALGGQARLLERARALAKAAA
jgi:hypothetical protein